MSLRRWVFAGVICVVASAAVVLACCPAPRSGEPVLNADQTVVIVWDAATKTQHFVRRASFKADADDFGFLIPSPTQPELSESGDDVFPMLATLTAPEVVMRARPTGGCGCSAPMDTASAGKLDVKVLDDKIVAGFRAVVLETRSSKALVDWLNANGYAFSPEVEAWAKPYVEQGWKITALKVDRSNAPATGPSTSVAATPPAASSGSVATSGSPRDVAAAALRMSFKTDRPLFPYREPDPKGLPQQLGTSGRLLRIFFIGESRYGGSFGQLAESQPAAASSQETWTGRAVWSGKVSSENRQRAMEALKLPENAGPAEWWLTEFEDRWPYRVAPGDVYFAPDADQSPIKRPATVQYVAAEPVKLAEAAPYVAVLTAVGLMPLFRRMTRARRCHWAEQAKK